MRTSESLPPQQDPHGSSQGRTMLVRQPRGLGGGHGGQRAWLGGAGSPGPPSGDPLDRRASPLRPGRRATNSPEEAGSEPLRAQPGGGDADEETNVGMARRRVSVRFPHRRPSAAASPPPSTTAPFSNLNVAASPPMASLEAPDVTREA